MHFRTLDACHLGTVTTMSRASEAPTTPDFVPVWESSLSIQEPWSSLTGSG